MVPVEWFGAHSRDDKGHDVNNDNHKCPTLFIPNSQALGSSTLLGFIYTFFGIPFRLPVQI